MHKGVCVCVCEREREREREWEGVLCVREGVCLCVGEGVFVQAYYLASEKIKYHTRLHDIQYKIW